MLIPIMVILIVLLFSVGFYFSYIVPKKDPIKKAVDLASQNRLMDAVAEYKRALYANPNDINVHYRIADMYIKLGELDQATFHLNEILRIDQYSSEVEKLDVQKKLANAYYLLDDIQKAFQSYLDILRYKPEDIEAQYHVSFIALGQEEFEIARGYFENLVKVEDNFEIYFGAAICNYQSQRFDDAVKYFKKAIPIKPNSDITFLAIAFALQRTESYKEAIHYVNKLLEKTIQDSVKFISKRLLAFLYIQSKRVEDGRIILLELLEFARDNEMKDEMLLCLYDLGFTCVKAEKYDQAYNYWDDLYNFDKNYNNIQGLLELLKKETDKSGDNVKDDFEMAIDDEIDDWISNAFSANFLWDICGLKSDKAINIKNMMVTVKYSREGKETKGETPGIDVDHTGRIEKYYNLDTENFKIISNRLVSKLGYKVDEILLTYRDFDGVDFLAYSDMNREKVLVWVRRWKESNVGEITVRNFAQAINDIKAKKGLLITTAELTQAAKNSLDKLSKVTIVYPEEVSGLLKGLI